MAPGNALVARMQRALKVAMPGTPPSAYLPAVDSEAARAERYAASRAYVQRSDFYRRVRDGLIAVVSTWKAAFLDARDIGDIVRLLPTPTWPQIVRTEMDRHVVPLSTQPVTSAVTAHAPPPPSAPTHLGATA